MTRRYFAHLIAFNDVWKKAGVRKEMNEQWPKLITGGEEPEIWMPVLARDSLAYSISKYKLEVYETTLKRLRPCCFRARPGRRRPLLELGWSDITTCYDFL